MAIAKDITSTAAASGTNLTTDLTWTHTCTGSNLALVVGVVTQTATNINPTSVKYNGVSMSLLTTQGNANPNLQLAVYYLANPTIGANTIDVNWSGASVARSGAIAISLTGTAASPAGNGASNAQATTTPSLPTTTGTANSWIIDFLEVGNTPETATATGTNQTKQDSIIVLSNFEINISTQTTTTAGSYTNSWSKGASSQDAQITLEIIPFVATGGWNIALV